MSSKPAQLDPIAFFEHWKGLPRQRAAVIQMWEKLPEEERTTAAGWYQTWKADGKQPDQAPPPPPPLRPDQVLLDRVPYFSQLDNASGQGRRECFSSSCAMVAAFWGMVRSDDEYNRVRAPFGDTTNAQAQIAALRKLGLDARLVTNAAPGLLESELRAGRPVAVGWLHRGPISAPTGGGHWSVVIGFDPENWVHHDPNGEADMIRGGYLNHSGGKEIHYSRKNWGRRWEADGPSTGWAMLIKPL